MDDDRRCGMTAPLVYLSGQISGLTYGDAQSWRDFAIRYLADRGIKGVSPLRGEKAHDASHAQISAHGRDYAKSPLLTAKAITDRDRFDATRCDVMLVNLLDMTRISIGTMIEIGWADAHRIPIVLAAPEPGVAHLHDHLMVNEIASVRAHTLEDALDCVVVLLG
jgi:nucleoside 2-deoxyribosyltransferase